MTNLEKKVLKELYNFLDSFHALTVNTYEANDYESLKMRVSEHRDNAYIQSGKVVEQAMNLKLILQDNEGEFK